MKSLEKFGVVEGVMERFVEPDTVVVVATVATKLTKYCSDRHTRGVGAPLDYVQIQRFDIGNSDMAAHLRRFQSYNPFARTIFQDPLPRTRIQCNQSLTHRRH
jgi:hypothetical protein